jgi:hypothetical protein
LRRFALPLLLGILALVGGWRILAIGLAEQAAQARLGPIAHQLRPSHARGTALAANFYLHEDNERSARLAARAVWASPIDPVAVGALARARNALDPGAGDRLMLMGAELGWRDRPIQIWTVERALLAGDAAVAMSRIEALARLGADQNIVFPMLRLLALDTRGRELIVASLAEAPPWRTPFLRHATPAPVEQRRALGAILIHLSDSSAPPDVHEARVIIDGLADAGEAGLAHRAYSALGLASGDDSGLLSDPGFERDRREYLPANRNTVFDWRVFSSGSDQASVEGDPSEPANNVVFARAGDSLIPRLLERYAALPAGRYRLRYRVMPRTEEASAAFRWIVTCGTERRPLFEETPPGFPAGRWSTRQLSFVVPPTGCPSQIFTLTPARRGADGLFEAWFDDVHLASVDG